MTCHLCKNEKPCLVTSPWSFLLIQLTAVLYMSIFVKNILFLIHETHSCTPATWAFLWRILYATSLASQTHTTSKARLCNSQLYPGYMGIFVENILFLILATHSCTPATCQDSWYMQLTATIICISHYRYHNNIINNNIIVKKRNEIWQKLFKQKYCNVGMTWPLVKKGEKQEADNTWMVTGYKRRETRSR